MLDKAQAKVGRLVITVNLPGADVLIDGQVVGKTPLPGPVFVEPGQVFIEARLPGYTQERVIQTAVAGAEETVNLSLTKSTGPVGAAQGTSVVPSVVPSVRPSDNRKRIAGGLLLGVGGASIVVGAATGLTAKAKYDSAVQQCPTRQGCTQAVHDSGTSGKTLALVYTGALVAGAVTVGAGIPVLALDAWERRARVGAILLPGGLGLGLTAVY
jgi:hypothetical protein